LSRPHRRRCCCPQRARQLHWDHLAKEFEEEKKKMELRKRVSDVEKGAFFSSQSFPG